MPASTHHDPFGRKSLIRTATDRPGGQSEGLRAGPRRRTLQHAILAPTELPHGFTARYTPAVPALEVGGDWYDVIPLPAELGDNLPRMFCVHGSSARWQQPSGRLVDTSGRSNREAIAGSYRPGTYTSDNQRRPEPGSGLGSDPGDIAPGLGETHFVAGRRYQDGWGPLRIDGGCLSCPRCLRPGTGRMATDAKKVRIMADVACLCGCLHSFDCGRRCLPRMRQIRHRDGWTARTRGDTK
jgi:hypothetical protein